MSIDAQVLTYKELYELLTDIEETSPAVAPASSSNTCPYARIPLALATCHFPTCDTLTRALVVEVARHSARNQCVYQPPAFIGI